MEDTNRELLNQFVRYHHLLLRYHHQHHSHGRRGPYMDTMRGQGRVLSLLKMKPEITQKELAYLLDMRVQSLSELLSKLEDKGYITRTPSQADRRVMVIHLTEAGAGAVEDTAPPEVELPFQCLSEEERGVLSGLLERLISAMEEHLGASEGREADPRMGMWGGFGRGGHDAPPPPHSHSHRGNPRDMRDMRAMMEQMFEQWGAKDPEEEE